MSTTMHYKTMCLLVALMQISCISTGAIHWPLSIHIDASNHECDGSVRDAVSNWNGAIHAQAFSVLPGATAPNAVAAIEVKCVTLPAGEYAWSNATNVLDGTPALVMLYEHTYNTALHELGHTLGLDHMPESEDIMQGAGGSVDKKPSTGRITGADLAAIKAMWKNGALR